MDNVEEVIRHLDQVNIDKTKFHEMLSEAFERILPSGSTSRTLAMAGAAVSVPLALGYMYNHYVNSKKIKEKLTWEQLKSGANIISRVFSNYHVKYIFSLSETECDPIIECCSSLRIKVIKMKNINNALNAADGIYRATEQVGCIFVSTSQDLLALSNTTINFPLLVVGINELMDTDKGMMGSVVQSEHFPIWSLHSFKSCEFVKSITDIAPTLEKSLDRCMQSPFGPMYLEFSQEMIVPEGEIQKNNMMMNQSKWYFKRVWNDIQHSFTYPSSDTEVVFHHFQKDCVKAPKADQIREVLDLIYEAENPLLLLGDQCLTSGQYEDEVLRNDSLKLSIKLLGLPTYLTGFTKVLNDSSFQNVIHDNLEYALKHSDLIISCGIPTNILNDLLEHHQQHISDNLSKKRMVIVDTLMSNKGFSLFGHGLHRSFFESIKRSNYRVEPSTFLHHLGYMMPRNYNKFQSWIMDLKEKDSISSLIFDKKSKFKGEHLNSYLVLEALRDSLQNSQSRPIIVCDNGQFEECAQSMLADCVRAWIQLDHTCVRHNTNSAIGLAIASKLCNPSVDVWLLCDDRSISQCIPEFETLNRYHIPINIVVGNVEGSIGEMSSDDQVVMDKDSKKIPQIHHDHPKTAFHKIMVAYGGKSFSLSHNNAKREELEKSFADARERSSVSQRPILINCHIDKPVPSLIGGGAM
ncbi:hypothetical protein DFA_12125 [Cavenderia fasciculata]|uniref:2-hydroxyacyl-CoA lyase n=1 Tax=Cavenderia fasciculata TaxID=261658 RepID=F4QC74_CACFS|nr:uncharacterized protein DFA_12125 [Cavenderia fasciculata]EGG14355.1 hypothetical protein DFA_12125 [Cavenderia fasciculata]|eukprot:XP_004351074.1 hypothetical protein DFA_12125 [Cavenderia fasciculata]